MASRTCRQNRTRALQNRSISDRHPGGVGVGGLPDGACSDNRRCCRTSVRHRLVALWRETRLGLRSRQSSHPSRKRSEGAWHGTVWPPPIQLGASKYLENGAAKSGLPTTDGRAREWCNSMLPRPARTGRSEREISRIRMEQGEDGDVGI